MQYGRFLNIKSRLNNFENDIGGYTKLINLNNS
jgi:hypothetical protein